MFCPKCGLQNADEIKFCRACGADLSNVLAVVDGKSHSAPALTEKYIDLLGSGLRGVLIGIGFLIVSSASFAISMLSTTTQAVGLRRSIGTLRFGNTQPG